MRAFVVVQGDRVVELRGEMDVVLDGGVRVVRTRTAIELEGNARVNGVSGVRTLAHGDRIETAKTSAMVQIWSTRARHPYVEPIVVDPVMMEVHRTLDRLTEDKREVVLVGEPGVGKALLAEKLQRRVKRVVRCVLEPIDGDAVTILIPPLRDRPSEILPLAAHFAGGELAPDVAEMLVKHDWPGNVGELETVIALGHRGERRVEDIRGQLAEIERAAIVAALEANHNSQTRAAVKLGLSRRALIYKMEKYGLKPPAARFTDSRK